MNEDHWTVQVESKNKTVFYGPFVDSVSAFKYANKNSFENYEITFQDMSPYRN